MSGRRIWTIAMRWSMLLRLNSWLTVLLALASSVESMRIDVDFEGDDCVIIDASEGSTINANYEVLGPPKDTMVIFRLKRDKTLLYKKAGLAEHYFQARAEEAGDYELCFINGNKGLIERMHNKDPEVDVRMVGLDALRRQKKEKLRVKEQDLAKLDDDDDYSNKLTDGKTGEPSNVEYYSGSWYGQESARKTFGFGLWLGDDGEDQNAMPEVNEKEQAMAKFLKEEADVLVRTLSFFNDHESYMRGREEFHRENVKQTSSRLMWCTFVEAAVLIWVSWSQLSYIRRFFETKRVM